MLSQICFVFPLRMIFCLFIYRDEFFDVADMANSMLQAYGIIQKCLQIPESARIDGFDPTRSSDFCSLRVMDWVIVLYGSHFLAMVFTSRF